ncbi:hypothetical protein E3E31_03965 [Thermococcus sp. M39]|uniref:hypothetical protein n=1 Tax=unclassified Thermococcus TaxID=2627626 RepID=UPI001438DF2C|nr:MULTISPECIES: hypothetical protein [unclassified Thermococcus]NJE07686.1 hypothetical protein [Thermococcus sp. M39]NJE12242.1 hypothetical protein [Thermococcus sp. LS2]
MPGPYFPAFYSEMTRVDYLIVGFWIILLIIVAFSMHSLKNSLDGVLDEVKGINAVAQKLKEQSKSVNELLQEV